MNMEIASARHEMHILFGKYHSTKYIDFVMVSYIRLYYGYTK